MAGAWRGGLSFANATSIGATTSGNSSGTLLPGSGSTFTKSAWTQLTASTTTDINWVSITAQSLTSGGNLFGVDIGVGAPGSEIIVVANLNFDAYGGNMFVFPLCIPAGSRIAARYEANATSATLRLLMQGFQDTYQSAGSGSAIDTYGYNTSLAIGAAVDAGGTANTNGVYTQITASTTSDYTGFFVAIDGQNATGTVGTVQYLLDVAVGGAGSEVIILPDTLVIYSNLGTSYYSTTSYFPIPIAASSRIAVRTQCTTATSPDRIIGVTFYGVKY